MLTLIIPAAHMQAAHPFVLWHLIWPLHSLYVFVNYPCLVSDILEDRQGEVVGYVMGPQVHKEWGQEGEKVRNIFLLC